MAASRPPRLILWPKRILYLVIASVALYAADRAGLKWTLATLVVAGPLVAIDVVLRWVTQKQGRRFEKQLTTLLQAGRTEELLPLYDRQRLLRFAGPRHLTNGKLGLIYTHLGQPHLAAAAYREAFDDAPHAESYTLAVALANSLYEIGELAEAERVYRGAIDDERINVKACANLARLIVKRGGDLEEAEGYLKMAVQAAGDGALRCELVQLLTQRGKLEQARNELESAERELKDSEDEDARAALALARSVVPPAEADEPKAEPEAAGSADTAEPESET